MLTEEQALTELRQLNQELGLPEGYGMPMTQAQAEAELRALDEQLASTPESFGEYVERRKVEDSRSLGDKTAAFTESFMTGAGALASEGSKAISELFAGDVGTSEVGGVFKVGINDFGRFAETLGGAAMDNFYSDGTEMQREYQRYKDNFLYNQEVRPAMLETYDEEGRDFVSFGANFVDPTLLVPAAGLIAKGGSLGAKAVAVGAKGISKGAKAGAFAARSPRLVQLSRAMARTSRGAEKVAKGAKKVAEGLDKASEVASIPAKLAASGTRKAIKGSAFVGSKIAGGVAKTGELASKTAALPRNIVTGLASKVIDPKIAGSGILGAQATGVLTGAVPGLGLLTGTEALGYIANKTGRGVERTLSALSSTGGQKRFLQRLATTADSPRLRKLALMAHASGATKLTDLAFNSLVNGVSVGALNGALAYASGEGAEGVGAAVGSGTLMGGSLPFGQPGMKGGKSQAARDQSSINFLNAKLQGDQIKEFRKLSPEARLAFATVEEAGIPRPQLAFLDKQTYLDLLREDDPNLRSAPNAHYGIADNTIYINQDGNAGRSSKEAMDILTHELGHHFIKQAIKDDPFFAEKILSEYKAKSGEESFDFAFTTDSAGAPIDSIKLNKKAVDIADLYGGIQDGIGIGRNAEKLAQEIGAEQFAMMMVDNPNIFKTIEPSLRQKLLDGSRKVLTMFGAVDPYTGNPLDVSILGPGGVKSKNPLVQRSKSIRNLYKNYVKQRDYALADKIDLAENPMKIKLQRGEKPQQAVQRLFNTKGISLKEAKAFRINNLKVKEKLVEIKKRLLENPTGGMRAFVNKSGNAIAIIGKTLTPEVRSVFTGNDPFGNINTLINVAIDGIREKAQFTFLYRAGKPSKYSDNELRPRVVSPIQLRVTGLSDNSKSAASLKLDCFDEAYLRNNAEVLVQEGFAKDPKTLIEEGRRVAKESLNDPEGRINPKGEKENELVTALFGQPESAGFIKNKKLRALLDPEQGGRLKHSFRSYDFDALAGLVPTGKDGISFDWDNVKHNHMPLDDKLFMPTETFEGSPGSYFRPKSSRDTSAQVRTFKSPVQLKDGSRLSGVADNPEQSPFYGFDKNGQEFSQGREYINPQDITKSRDSDRTANQIRNELESGQKLFMPASEAGATKGKVAEAAKLWNEKGIDSPYFKKWFGKSKVVDENGEALVVYHGTTKQEAFTEFKRQDPSNENSPHIWNELGLAFFSDSPEVANKYTYDRSFNSNADKKQTGRILPIYLQVKNPKKISYDALGTIESKGEIMRIKQAFEDQGHDGFMLDRGDGFDYVPFKPEQIKSATGNRGTFDAGERNILFMPQMAMKSDPSVKYHYDTQTMDRPPVKDVSALSGERLAGVLEADRHDARGGRMAGPAHPFLKSNQATATVDGIKWKPVWANMKYQFVKTQIGKQMKSTNGYNLVAIMDEFAHRSNRDVFTRMMKKIQSASKKMTPEEKLVTAQIINIFDIRYTPKKERGNKLKESMLSFVSDLGTAKSQATRNNMEGFNKLLKKSVDKVKSNSWWDSQSIKSNSKDFRKYTKDMTFNKRGAILKALEGLPWLPDIQKFLKSEMDFEGAPTDKAVLAVQLSKHKLNSNERVFAIYTGKDPDQARWMTKNEREVLRQLRADPNFREHPSYDWMMLGKADSDNFYLDKPVNLDKLIPTYRRDHKRSKTQEYKAQLSKTKNYLSKTPKSKGFLFSGKGDKADNAFLKTFSETKSKKAGIENVYKGKERLVVGAMKRNAKVPIIIP